MRFTSDTGDRRILSVTQRRAADDNPALECLYRVGVTASVIDLARHLRVRDAAHEAEESR